MSHRTRSNFFRDTRGNLSITAAVVGVMLLTVVGASLDGGQMFSTKQRLQSITDAAALMAATPEGVSPAKRKALAEISIRSHVERVGRIDISSTTITVNEADGQVYVALAADVPLLFGGVLGSDMRRVSASSLAEETKTSSVSLNPLSISLVLDLSGSMGDRFDNASKLASVNSAVSEMLNSISSQFGSDVAAATQISTGVYPFNWGMVDGETVALEPGTRTMLASMTNLSLAEGSVPTTAMERAVADQLLEMKTRKNRDRFIVYVSDGKIEEDKSDIAGRYLNTTDLFRSEDDRNCQLIAQELASLDELSAPDLVDPLGVNSALTKFVPELKLPNVGTAKKKRKLLKHIRKLKSKYSGEIVKINLTPLEVAEMEERLKSDKHAGHNHDDEEVKDKGKRAELRETFLSICQPAQPLRVAEACEEARNGGISIVAINLSGQDSITTNPADICVNGIVLDDGSNKKLNKNGRVTPAPNVGSRTTKTLPSGIEIRVSADGKSYAGDAKNLEQLRDMLGSMLPAAGKKERHVRLVG